MKKLFTSWVVASTAATLATCGKKATTTDTKTTTTEKAKPKNKTTHSPYVYIKGVIKTPETTKLEALDNIYKELDRLMQKTEYNLDEKQEVFTRLYAKFIKLGEEVQGDINESLDDTKQKALDKINTKFHELVKKVEYEIVEIQGPKISEAQDDLVKSPNVTPAKITKILKTLEDSEERDLLHEMFPPFVTLRQETEHELNQYNNIFQLIEKIISQKKLEQEAQDDLVTYLIARTITLLPATPGIILEENPEPPLPPTTATQAPQISEDSGSDELVVESDTQPNEDPEEPEISKQQALENIYTEVGRLMQQSEYNINEKEKALTRLKTQFDELTLEVLGELYESRDATKQQALENIYLDFNTLKKEVIRKLYILWKTKETLEQEILNELDDESSETSKLDISEAQDDLVKSPNVTPAKITKILKTLEDSEERDLLHEMFPPFVTLRQETEHELNQYNNIFQLIEKIISQKKLEQEAQDDLVTYLIARTITLLPATPGIILEENPEPPLPPTTATQAPQISEDSGSDELVVESDTQPNEDPEEPEISKIDALKKLYTKFRGQTYELNELTKVTKLKAWHNSVHNIYTKLIKLKKEALDEVNKSLEPKKQIELRGLINFFIDESSKALSLIKNQLEPVKSNSNIPGGEEERTTTLQALNDIYTKINSLKQELKHDIVKSEHAIISNIFNEPLVNPPSENKENSELEEQPS